MKVVADPHMSISSHMTTRFTTLAGGVLLGGSLALMPVAHAQPAGELGSTVDMTIADHDPVATSLRRVETGNAQFAFQNRLTVANFNANWSPFDPGSPSATDFSTGLVHSQGYQYRSPGLRALIDRPEYVGVRGGGEVMIIPANTVFQLTLERPRLPVDPRPAAHDNFRDHRMERNGRIASDLSNPPTGSGFQNLRLERVPVSELRPIPHPSQMRFPQAAYPGGYVEPEPYATAEQSSEKETLNADPSEKPRDADSKNLPQATSSEPAVAASDAAE